MNGLLKNDFYACLGNGKIIAALLLALGAGLCVSGNETLLGALLLLSATALSSAYVAPLRREGKWARYLLTLPVRRRQIAFSHYAGFLASALCGTALAVAFTGATVLLHGNLYFYPGLRDFWSMTAFGFCGCLLMGACFFPLHYALGAERSDAALLISLAAAVGLIAAYSLLANALSEPDHMSDLRFYALIALFAVLAALAFGGSFLLSARLLERKEY
ncbi:ABC-2 transporter permease [Beduinella massiliensis]|uniref:ABC-2 transporter permease n=1 Tax=Beduinella massiliensis TaxID=1852363 RepID=UPI000C82C4FD